MMADQQLHLADRRRFGLLTVVGVAVLALALGAGVSVGALLGVGELFTHWAEGSERDAAGGREGEQKDEKVELLRDGEGRPGLRLTAEAMTGYGIRPAAARPAAEPRPLPPQVGSVNYDNTRLFNIRTRFPGEVAEMRQVEDTPGVPTRFPRPIRTGDKVKQGDLLCVVWSQQLGQAKAALVDAISGLALSKTTYEEQLKVFEEGALSLSVLRASLRQLRGDSNALATAERSLKMWKLTPDEIEAIRKEAAGVAELIVKGQKVRDTDMEAQWARVEVRVPWFDRNDPGRELTVVETNTNLNDMLDPINSPWPLFKVADLGRLQIWVHPPEEYLPVLRKNLDRAEREGRRLEWDVRFQADPPDAPPRKMQIVQIYPSIEPTQHTPLVVGYLNNAEGNYLVGQYLTATIYVPPVPDTVEIPAEALNEVGGQALVFVEANADRHEFTLRRVPVEARFKDVVIVRSKLTADDEKASGLERQKGRRPIEPLRPGERVMTRGIVELTTALDELLVEERIKRETSR
jgi:cobalt-zinc-cadmium efflux system membrane fusion protein